MGKAIFTIIGAMAELERNVVRERIVAGLEHGRTHGTKSDAAVGTTRVLFRRAKILELRTEGKSWHAIAATLGVGIATVH